MRMLLDRSFVSLSLLLLSLMFCVWTNALPSFLVAVTRVIISHIHFSLRVCYVVEDSKTVRGRLGRLERRAAADRRPVETTQFAELVEMAEQVAGQFGTSLQKQQLAMLRRELERAASKGDGKAIQRASAEIEALRWRVLFKHDWFWREIFDSLCQPNTPFVNPAEARTLITKGQAAVSGGDGEGLRGVVRSLWNLQPKGNAEASRERAVRSGLRKF